MHLISMIALSDPFYSTLRGESFRTCHRDARPDSQSGALLSSGRMIGVFGSLDIFPIKTSRGLNLLKLLSTEVFETNDIA